MTPEQLGQQVIENQEAIQVSFETAVIIVCGSVLALYYGIAYAIETYRRHRVK